MCWIDSGEGVAQAALTLVLSLSVFTVASVVMIWLNAWEPKVLTAIAVVTPVSCLMSLRRAATR